MPATRQFRFDADADTITEFRWVFDAVLARTADEVGVAGAVHVTDDGTITVTDHPYYVREVTRWLGD